MTPTEKVFMNLGIDVQEYYFAGSIQDMKTAVQKGLTNVNSEYDELEAELQALSEKVDLIDACELQGVITTPDPSVVRIIENVLEAQLESATVDFENLKSERHKLKDEIELLIREEERVQRVVFLSQQRNIATDKEYQAASAVASAGQWFLSAVKEFISLIANIFKR